MNLIKLLFFFGAFVVFYSYLGYGLLLWLFLKIKKIFTSSSASSPQPAFLPPVTLIVAAYNEEDFIIEKIHNSLAIDYPETNLHLLFITDGSADSTPEIVRKFPRVRLLHEPARLGKVAAMHRAMSYVNTPFVVFSDANTLLNDQCIRNIVKHYQNVQVGGVAGEKKVIHTAGDGVNGSGEGLYWKYESFLKKLDWEFYTVVGAAGELFSVRTSLYEYPGDNVLLDDFIISLRICQKGYRVAYEPGAYATETPSSSLKEEQKRKIRISAGGFQSMFMLKGLLNILKYPLLSFQYISHRVLRWTLCPLFLPLIFLSNLLLIKYDSSPSYTYIFVAQLVFYGFAFIGWLLSLKNIRISFLYVPYYFIFINISLYIGFFRFLKGKQTVLWEKAARIKTAS